MHKARDEFKRQLAGDDDDDDDDDDESDGEDEYTEEDFKVGFLESKYSKKLLTNNNQTVAADDKNPGAFKKVASAENGKSKPWEVSEFGGGCGENMAVVWASNTIIIHLTYR